MVGRLPTTAFWQVTQNAQIVLGDTPAAQRYFKMMKRGIQQSDEQAYTCSGKNTAKRSLYHSLWF